MFKHHTRNIIFLYFLSWKARYTREKKRQRATEHCRAWVSRLLSSEGFELTLCLASWFFFFSVGKHFKFLIFFSCLSTWSRCEAWLNVIEFRPQPDERFVQTNMTKFILNWLTSRMRERAKRRFEMLLLSVKHQISLIHPTDQWLELFEPKHLYGKMVKCLTSCRHRVQWIRVRLLLLRRWAEAAES